jgi:tRNA U34 5-carboxymethylaminomethyl modifying GTPase MnmE/TrmE
MPIAPTTACLLTPPGKGGIAVISLRGRRAGEILAKLFRPLRSHAEGGEGRLQLGRLVADGRILDEAVVQSQGDWAEVNIHGGPAVARGVLVAMLRAGATIEPDAPPSSLTGLPAAHPRWNNPAIGEEMLGALPQAASATVVSAVTVQWAAGISELARTVLRELEPCPESRPIAMGRNHESVGRAYLPDASTHLPGASRASMPDLRMTASRLRRAADGLAVMRRILEPAEVVLTGPPNAGKSTLANALVGRPISIVHQTPGTTRDWVRELALIRGIPVWITDTAGLGCDEGPAAARGEGVSRGEGILRGEGVSPLRVAGILPARAEGILPSVVSSSSFSSSAAASVSSPASQGIPPAQLPAPESHLVSEIDRQSSDRALERIARADLVLVLGQPPAAAPRAQAGRAKVIPVWTKADACPPPSKEIGDCPYFCVSAPADEGLEQLKEGVLDALGLADFDPALPRAFTARQAALLLAAAESLDRDDPAQAAASLRNLLEA